ncbi:hypothetical protein FRB95_007826 [Tulasnella sp. JGI-2019a]|nr:hypothetical protein FRB95_007826 [Tulasnella sp. JGI-2019a]
MPLPFPVDAPQPDHLSIISNGGYYTNEDSEVGTPFSPGPDPINGYLVPPGFQDPHHPQLEYPPSFSFDPSNPQMLHQYSPPIPLIGQHPDFYGPYGEPDLPTPSSPPQGHMDGDNGYQNGVQHRYVEQHYELPEASASSPPRLIKPPPKRKTKRVRQPLPKTCSFCFQKDREGVSEEFLTCNACQRSGHPSCLQIAHVVDAVRTYDWKCLECKDCEVCGRKDQATSFLFCDNCDRGWHTHCLTPPLQGPPEGHWACPTCQPTPAEGSSTIRRSSSIASSSRAAVMTIQTPIKSSRKGKEKAVEPIVVMSQDTDTVMIDAEEKASVAQPSLESTAPRRKITIKQNNRIREQRSPPPSQVIPDRDGSPPALPPIRLVRRRSTAGNGTTGPKVRLKLGRMKDKSKGKGKATMDQVEGTEEIVPDAFLGVLNPADADVSKTSIWPEDQRRFESSKAAAERILGPSQILPPPFTPGGTPGPKQPSIEPDTVIQPARSYITLRHLRRLDDSSLFTPRPATPSERDIAQTPMTARMKEGSTTTGPSLRIRSIRFGEHEIDTWYDAPFSEEYASVPDGKLWICEFCLRYMKSAFSAGRHRMKCRARHPPGDEIYRDDAVSVFEVDGRKNKIYCQNLCLLSKMFLDHKSLFYDVEPFLFYVMTEMDDVGARFVGYFSKEKRSLKEHNLSCIMTLPVRQKKGWGNLLIDFSYLLSKKEGRIGGPETPLSALGAISYKRYWTLTLMYYLRTSPKNVTLPGISVETSMTMEDALATLRDNDMITVLDPASAFHRHVASKPPPPRPRGRPPRGGYPRGSLTRPNHTPSRPAMPRTTPTADDGEMTFPRLYRIHWDPEVVEKYIAQWESRGYLQLKPEVLKWSPFLLSRTQEAEQIIGDAHETDANTIGAKTDDLALVEAMAKRAEAESARIQMELAELERMKDEEMRSEEDGLHEEAIHTGGSLGGRSPRPLRPPKGFIPTKAPRHRVETPASRLKIRTRSSRDVGEHLRARRSSTSSEGEEVSSGRSLRRLRIRESEVASPRDVVSIINSRKRKRLPSPPDAEDYASVVESDDNDGENGSRHKRNRTGRSTTSLAPSLSHDGGEETPGRRRLRSAGEDLENGVHTVTPRTLRSSRGQPSDKNTTGPRRRRIESSPEQEDGGRRGSARRTPSPLPGSASKLTANGKRRGRPPKLKLPPTPAPPTRSTRNERSSKARSRRSTPTDVTEDAPAETDAEGEAEVERVVASSPSSPQSPKSTTEAQRRLRSLRLDFESTGSLSSVGPDYRELSPAEEEPVPPPVINNGDAPPSGLELVLGDDNTSAERLAKPLAETKPPVVDVTMMVTGADSLEMGHETEEDAEGEEEWD